jgi:exopolyphosphatase/guanosine-5'-triphosphate,3'-diphosphate pyrophosphatase
MAAVLDELGLGQVIFADSALREGVLYTMDDRLKHSDIRERTAMDLAVKYGIDRDQADRVRGSVQHMVDQVADAWQFNHEDRQMLIWAATLHEIGLQINYSGFHRHGAYIVANTPLPGFNREQQDVLATLIRLHRKRFDLSVIPELRNWSRDRIVRLARVLRIACVLNFGRHDETPFSGHVRIKGESLTLEFPEQALESHPVVTMDLDEEIKRQQEAGLKLSVG